MTGYTRQRNAEIANDNIANADDVAAEFNQLQSAFNASTGHRHNGVVGEGPPITVVGPNQQVQVDVSALFPSTTDTVDLGKTSQRFREGYFSGPITAPSFVGNVTGNTSGSAATLATPRNINGTAFNGSANITTAEWGTGRTVTIGNTARTVNGSTNVSWSLTEIGAASRTLTITAGSGLTGGGDLTANRTVALSSATEARLTLADNSVQTSRVINTSGLATGGGNLTVDRTINVPIASQAQAQAGTDNTTAMTPLTTAQAISALLPLPLAVNQGGTGATTAAAARTALGVPAVGDLPPALTQGQVQNAGDTTQGTVSGQRLAQASQSLANGAAGWPKITPAALDRVYVQSGGGLGHGNQIAIGWDGSGFVAQVDGVFQGTVHTSLLPWGATGTYAILFNLGGFLSIGSLCPGSQLFSAFYSFNAIPGGPGPSNINFGTWRAMTNVPSAVFPNPPDQQGAIFPGLFMRVA